jgi:hypothetical protein
LPLLAPQVNHCIQFKCRHFGVGTRFCASAAHPNAGNAALERRPLPALKCRHFGVGTRFCASAPRPNAGNAALERWPLPALKCRHFGVGTRFCASAPRPDAGNAALERRPLPALKCRHFGVGTRFCASAPRPDAGRTLLKRWSLPREPTAFHCNLVKKSPLERPLPILPTAFHCDPAKKSPPESAYNRAAPVARQSNTSAPAGNLPMVVICGGKRLSETVVRVGHTASVCSDTPDSAPGVPASAGVWLEPAEAGTPAPGPYPHDQPFSDSL